MWECGDLGIWKPGDLEIQKFGDLGTWKFRNVDIWGFGNLEIWVPKKSNTKMKNQIRSAQKVDEVWISKKNPPGPIWGHLRHFSIGLKL